MDEQEDSLTKNLTSGGGCGCGCLGLLVGLVGIVSFATIPLEMVTESEQSTAIIVGASAVVSGLLMFFLGAAAYVASLFLE